MLASYFTPFLPPYILSDTFCPVTTASLPRIAMTYVLVSGWLDVSVPCSVKQIHQGDTIHHRNNISYNNTNRFIKEIQNIIRKNNILYRCFKRNNTPYNLYEYNERYNSINISNNYGTNLYQEIQ